VINESWYYSGAEDVTDVQTRIAMNLKGRLEYLRKELVKCSWDDSRAKGRVDREVQKAIQTLSDTSL
jgi:hypothetical protein